MTSSTAPAASNVTPIIRPEGKKSPRILSPKDAAKLYAQHKTDTGWCVDMSGNHPILLNARSDITGSVQSLRGLFNDWAIAEKIKVKCDSYPVFLSTLHDRVIPEMHKIFGKGMRPCSDRFIYDDNGIKLANIFNPATTPDAAPLLPAPFDKTVDLFGQQVPEILAEALTRAFPIEGQRRFVIQRLAAIVQFPMRKVTHGLFLVGEGGTGKSTVLDLVETALCRRHVDRTPTYTMAQDQFSEVFVNNRVVAFEDKAIGSGGETYVYTNLKQVVDYDRRRVSIKHGQRSVMREVHCSVVITTNNPGLLPFDSNERRWYAPQFIKHHVSEEESGVFFGPMRDFLALPEAPAFLYHWLANVDMTGFDFGRCPRTPYMQELIDQGGSMLDKHLDDFFQDRDICHPKQLSQYLTGRKQAYRADELKASLTLRGMEYKRMDLSLPGEDQRYSVWRIRPPAGRQFRRVSNEERAELNLYESGKL
jgi:hypothetical protein